MNATSPQPPLFPPLRLDPRHVLSLELRLDLRSLILQLELLLEGERSPCAALCVLSVYPLFPSRATNPTAPSLVPSRDCPLSLRRHRHAAGEVGTRPFRRCPPGPSP